MNRITTKPAPAPVGATMAGEAVDPSLPAEERGLGWSLALAMWVVAFVVLVLFEAWNFLFPLISGLFR